MDRRKTDGTADPKKWGDAIFHRTDAVSDDTTGKTFKLDPRNPFKPTMKQIKEVFQNRIDEEPAIDDNIFTGFLGLNSQAYIIYFIMEQQKQIDRLTEHLALMTKQINTLTSEIKSKQK